VDPMAGKYPQWSPYVYCFNNPLNNIDPSGKNPIIPKGIIIQILKKVIKNPKVHKWLAKKLCKNTGKKIAKIFDNPDMFGTENEILYKNGNVIGVFKCYDKDGKPLYKDLKNPDSELCTEEELYNRYNNPKTLDFKYDKRNDADYKDNENMDNEDEKNQENNNEAKQDNTRTDNHQKIKPEENINMFID
jgi:hypothetical protein